eukprot:457811-Alexandrium_andersonii.AAC.1
MAAASGLCPGPLRSNVTSRQHAGMCSATRRTLHGCGARSATPPCGPWFGPGRAADLVRTRGHKD